MHGYTGIPGADFPQLEQICSGSLPGSISSLDTMVKSTFGLVIQGFEANKFSDPDHVWLHIWENFLTCTNVAEAHHKQTSRMCRIVGLLSQAAFFLAGSFSIESHVFCQSSALF